MSETNTELREAFLTAVHAMIDLEAFQECVLDVLEEIDQGQHDEGRPAWGCEGLRAAARLIYDRLLDVAGMQFEDD